MIEINSHSTNFNTIPIFDLKKCHSKQFINLLRTVCHQVGFFYIKNHGLSQKQMTKMLNLTSAFFDLPDHEKEAISISRSPHYRGYGKLCAELTKGKPDFKETYDLGLETSPSIASSDKPYLLLRGPNQWPDAPQLKKMRWKENMLDYIQTLQKIGEQLIGAMSLALGFPENFLRSQFCGSSQDAYAILRLLRYPPGHIRGADEEPELGVGPHVDSGCLIILLQDSVGGLQVQNCEGQWIDAAPIPGTLVVNIGEMLQIWSNNYFQATPHRVINTSNKIRHSIPFFFEPNLSSVITPLDLPDKKLFTSDRLPVNPDAKVIYGEHMLKVYQRSFQ